MRKFHLAAIAVVLSFLFAFEADAQKPADKPFNCAQYLQDISVTVKTMRGTGSGTLKVTKDGQVWVWTCGHVVESLRRERTGADGKKFVEFDDAKVMRVETEEGRKVGEQLWDAEIIRYSDAREGHDLALLRMRSKRFKPVNSVKFYLDKDIPSIGTDLMHCGSLLGDIGSNSVTTGIVSQHGRMLFGVPFDQTNCATFPGSSGGSIVQRSDGRYIGCLVRGAGETFSLYVPVRRMQQWAKKTGVEFTMDDDLPIPTDEELKKTPVDGWEARKPGEARMDKVPEGHEIKWNQFSETIPAPRPR